MDSKWLALLILLVISAVHGASTEPAATGKVEICLKGTGPGDCTEPQGIATDTETGAVYVADSGNHRIDAFDSDGSNPRNFGEAEVQTWLTVDNHPDSPSHHDLYVASLDYEVRKLAPDGTELDNFGGKGDGRCQLMRTIDPIAIGPGGQVDVVDSDEIRPEFFVNRIEQWSPKGKCEGEIPLFKGNLYTRNFTVDGKGNFYVTVAGAGGEIRKFSPRGKLIYTVGPESTSEGLAIGPHGELFAKQSGIQASKNAAIEFFHRVLPVRQAAPTLRLRVDRGGRGHGRERDAGRPALRKRTVRRRPLPDDSARAADRPRTMPGPPAHAQRPPGDADRRSQPGGPADPLPLHLHRRLEVTVHSPGRPGRPHRRRAARSRADRRGPRSVDDLPLPGGRRIPRRHAQARPGRRIQDRQALSDEPLLSLCRA